MKACCVMTYFIDFWTGNVSMCVGKTYFQGCLKRTGRKGMKYRISENILTWTVETLEVG